MVYFILDICKGLHLIVKHDDESVITKRQYVSFGRNITGHTLFYDAKQMDWFLLRLTSRIFLARRLIYTFCFQRM